jgi:hypothetical protein
MKDPVRWRDDKGGADPEMRDLLADNPAETPSQKQRERIWAGLAPHIQFLPAPPPVIPLAPAAVTGSAALLGKITLGVLLVGTVGAGVHVARSRTHGTKSVPVLRAPAPKVTPAPVVSPEPIAPSAPVPVVEKPAARRPRAITPTSAKAVEVQESPVVVPPPVVVNNQLLEEGRRLSRARAALRAHDPEGALRLLQSWSDSNAGLAQEREALTIEALGARPSSRAEAERRARAFMTAYPDSPYRARLKALILEDR